MRESLESKRCFVDYKIQCVNASNGIKKNHADKNIKQNTCINTIYLGETSDWYAVMKLFVAQIFSSLVVVVAECKQKSKDGCSVNHRLIKTLADTLKADTKVMLTLLLWWAGHLRQCQVCKFNSEISHSFYTQQTYMYNYLKITWRFLLDAGH